MHPLFLNLTLEAKQQQLIITQFFIEKLCSLVNKIQQEIKHHRRAI